MLRNLFLCLCLTTIGAMEIGATQLHSRTVVRNERRHVVEYHDNGRVYLQRTTIFQDLAGGSPLVLFVDGEDRLLEMVFLSCETAVCQPVPVDANGQEIPANASLFFNPDRLKPPQNRH